MQCILSLIFSHASECPVGAGDLLLCLEMQLDDSARGAEHHTRNLLYSCGLGDVNAIDRHNPIPHPNLPRRICWAGSKDLRVGPSEKARDLDRSVRGEQERR